MSIVSASAVASSFESWSAAQSIVAEVRALARGEHPFDSMTADERSECIQQILADVSGESIEAELREAAAPTESERDEIEQRCDAEEEEPERWECCA